jgi:hypothetical protein
MVIRNITQSKAPVRQATRLAPDIQVSTKGIDSFGAVANTRGYSSNARRMPSAFTVVLDNSAVGVATLYMIGDPNGIVASKLGGAYLPATSATGITVAALQASLNQAPVLITGINYQSTSGLVQFAERLDFADGDLDRVQTQGLVVPQYIRNTANNPNLLTLRFDEGFELDWNAGFIVSAGANQRVVMTFMIGAAAGR